MPNADDGWLALLLVLNVMVWNLGPEIDVFPYFVSLPFQSAVPPVRPQNYVSHPLQFFIFSSYYLMRGSGSSVGIVTGYGPDSLGTESQWG